MFLYALAVLSLFQLTQCISKHPLVLVVSIDGFRHDFLNQSSTPYLYSLSKLGTHAEYMRNVFPTKTFVNHQSIVTGVYAEDHGVLANKVFFDGREHGWNSGLFENEDVVPIMTLNQKQGEGRHSGSMMWPGGEVKYKGELPTHIQPLDDKMNFTRRVDHVISWFKNDSAPANLVMFYFNDLDEIGHRRGINHPSFQQKFRESDALAKYLMEQLEANQLKERMNVFFLSDHGMVSVTREHMMDLRKFANLSEFTLTDYSPVIQMTVNAKLKPEVKKALINSTYSALKKAALQNGHFNIYLKDEIPERFHYKNNSRVSDMIAIAETEYGFQDLIEAFPWYEEKEGLKFDANSELGVHGYPNDDNVTTMYPFFSAIGPDLKQNFTIAPFDNIDLYPLFANILKLQLPPSTPTFQLRGKFEHVAPMLKSKIAKSS